MKIRNNRMDDEKIQKNMIKLISKKDPVIIGIHHTSPRKSGQSSWIEIPKPLPDWTQEEQRSLIEIIEQHPKAARDSAQLELAVVKAMRKMPNKTQEEIIQCFRHIQQCRVAYFGGIGGKDLSPTVRKNLSRRTFSPRNEI
jgi:hypothetical protein